jgi:hypothetical protein
MSVSSIEFELLQKATPFGSITDPTIPVGVRTLSGVETYWFLLDTGADSSAGPRSLAEQAGSDWDRLPAARVTGVGTGMAEVRFGDLQILLGGVSLTVRCLFIDSSQAPFVLGRADVLERFAVAMDARSGWITLTEFE